MSKPYDKETLSTIPSVIFGRFCAKIGVLCFLCETKGKPNVVFSLPSRLEVRPLRADSDRKGFPLIE